jgi:uncharacterized protein YxjI
MFILILASFSAVPVTRAQGTSPSAILYADFTGNTLPTNWHLQGTAQFKGQVNPLTGIGGIQLVRRVGFLAEGGEEGAVVYNSPVTTENITIQVSGMYNGTAYNMGDDIGVGFYSDGPSTGLGAYQPNSPNGYYASYQFCSILCSAYTPALLYQGKTLSSGGHMPASGTTYIFAEVDVSQASSSISMKISTSTNGPFTQTPSTGLTTEVTYQGSIDSSHAIFYIGGSSAQEASQQYVYWVRVSIGQPTSNVNSTTSISSPATPSSASSLQLSTTNSSQRVVIYAPIVIVIAIVGIVMALKRKQGTRATTAEEEPGRGGALNEAIESARGPMDEMNKPADSLLSRYVVESKIIALQPTFTIKDDANNTLAYAKGQTRPHLKKSFWMQDVVAADNPSIEVSTRDGQRLGKIQGAGTYFSVDRRKEKRRPGTDRYEPDEYTTTTTIVTPKFEIYDAKGLLLTMNLYRERRLYWEVVDASENEIATIKGDERNDNFECVASSWMMGKQFGTQICAKIHKKRLGVHRSYVIDVLTNHLDSYVLYAFAIAIACSISTDVRKS